MSRLKVMRFGKRADEIFIDSQGVTGMPVAGALRGRARALAIVVFVAVVALGVALGATSSSRSGQPAGLRVPLEPGEPPAELVGLGAQLQARASAPFAAAPAGAAAAGLEQKTKLATKGGSWTPVGADADAQRRRDVRDQQARPRHAVGPRDRVRGRPLASRTPLRLRRGRRRLRDGRRRRCVDVGRRRPSVAVRGRDRLLGADPHAHRGHRRQRVRRNGVSPASASTGRPTAASKWTKARGVPDEIVTFRHRARLRPTQPGRRCTRRRARASSGRPTRRCRSSTSTCRPRRSARATRPTSAASSPTS